MKIPVNSFYMDMNALLNELNSNNIKGYYNKVIHSTNHQMSSIINNMNQQIKIGKSSAKQRISDLQQQMKDLNDANKEMWNNEMPPAVNHAFNLALNTVPRNTDYYYPNGSSGPQDPQPGDVMWQSDDWSNVGSNDFNATMYVYYSNIGWKKINTPTQITGVNINGASIHGGMIQGATFRSGSQGVNGTPFWVNRDGTLYANNFISDLQHPTTGGINPYVYHGYLQNEEGFAIADGMLTMIAYAQQQAGTPIWSDWAAVQGATYLEPGYLKLRYDRGDNNYVRTDLRAGLLEIGGNSWNQNKGIKLGFWNSNNGDTPKLSFGSWTIGENGGADLSFTGPGNISTYQPIHAHGGIEADSLIVKGGFQVNNKTWADKSDINELKTRISQDEGKTDSNSDKIYNHGQILDGNGFSDPNNIINGSFNQDNHENRLNLHNQHLITHDTQISQLWDKLSQEVNPFEWHGNNIGIDASLEVGPTGNVTLTQDGSILGSTLWLGNQNGGAGEEITSTPTSLRVNGSLLATFDWVKDNFKRSSELNIKNNIHNVNSKHALASVLNTDIESWNYKNDKPHTKPRYGAIIDNVHNKTSQEYYTPRDLIIDDNNPGIDIADSVSFLFLSIQELEKQNSQLTQRVAKLEFDNKGSN